ncbi:MAG TPA: helix-turn-helix domain-containing protein, partial [Chloroflexota bacterium]|nr:helix-turn-helix domain-containing protein [Chloroflexota bacterium]
MAVHDEAPLATLLKRYRLAMGFTQEELAERAEMSARSVSDIERGLNRSPLPNTLRRLADALELAGEQRANFLGATHEAREAAPPPIRIDGRSPTRRSFGLSLRWLAVATLTALLVAAAALTLLRGLASGSAHSLSSSSSAPAVLASWGSPVRQTFSWLIGGSAIPGPHGEGNLYGGTQVTLGVVRASSSGQQLSSWQASGFYASDSKADPLGNLWLATSNNDIEEYSPDGRLLARLGSAGYNQGQFENPEGLGITSNGSIVVGDAGNDRIQVLSPNGRVLRVWQGPGSNPQRFGPYIIAVDRSDNVYVADVGNVLIEKYSLQGKLLADWKLQGTPGAHTGIDLTVDAAGNVYTLVEHFTSPTSYFFHIYKQSPSGRTLAVWSHLAAPPARNRPLITSLRFNDHGVALAADWENSRILKLDPAGRVLGVWDARQLRLPLFRSPEGLATDAAGNVYVADASGVVEVVAGGQDAQRWAAPVASGPASHFSGVAVDLAGNIVVSDTGKNRIETFSPSGKLLRSWGRPGIAVGDLGNPAKLAV